MVHVYKYYYGYFGPIFLGFGLDAEHNLFNTLVGQKILNNIPGVPVLGASKASRESISKLTWIGLFMSGSKIFKMWCMVF